MNDSQAALSHGLPLRDILISNARPPAPKAVFDSLGRSIEINYLQFNHLRRRF